MFFKVIKIFRIFIRHFFSYTFIKKKEKILLNKVFRMIFF